MYVALCEHQDGRLTWGIAALPPIPTRTLPGREHARDRDDEPHDRLARADANHVSAPDDLEEHARGLGRRLVRQPKQRRHGSIGATRVPMQAATIGAVGARRWQPLPDRGSHPDRQRRIHARARRQVSARSSSATCLSPAARRRVMPAGPPMSPSLPFRAKEQRSGLEPNARRRSEAGLGSLVPRHGMSAAPLAASSVSCSSRASPRSRPPCAGGSRVPAGWS
jgi:hypothetical protein